MIAKAILNQVNDKQKVHFQYYRDKELWYKTDKGFWFPVPIDDTAGATFKNEDDAILFMRYIRKYMQKMADDAVDKEA